MTLFDIGRANDYATGEQAVSEADIVERVDTFNNFHEHHRLDYELLPRGDFKITLYSEFPTQGWLPIGDAFNTLDTDEFWRQADEGQVAA